MQTVKNRGGRPRVTVKHDRAQVMLRPGLLDRIKALAEGEHRSVSNMLGVLVEHGMAYVEQTVTPEVIRPEAKEASVAA